MAGPAAAGPEAFTLTTSRRLELALISTSRMCPSGARVAHALTAPAPETPATAPSDPVALGTAPVAPEPAADVSVPMPELPPPPETKDFAEAAPTPARPAEPVPEAGGGKAA